MSGFEVEVKFYTTTKELQENGSREVLTSDKLAALGPGPWMEEPDYEAFEAHGFPCVIRRNNFGNWCGYVGVPPGHPWHGKNDDTIYDLPVKPEVHGGITYSDKCNPGMGVCHVPKEGESDDFWWLGFDTAHYRDLTPALTHNLFGRAPFEWETYKDHGYIKEETTKLASQALEAR